MERAVRSTYHLVSEIFIRNRSICGDIHASVQVMQVETEGSGRLWDSHQNPHGIFGHSSCRSQGYDTRLIGWNFPVKLPFVVVVLLATGCPSAPALELPLAFPGLEKNEKRVKMLGLASSSNVDWEEDLKPSLVGVCSTSTYARMCSWLELGGGVENLPRASWYFGSNSVSSQPTSRGVNPHWSKCGKLGNFTSASCTSEQAITQLHCAVNQMDGQANAPTEGT